MFLVAFSVRKAEHTKEDIQGYPLIERVALYVTISCNLKCKHCYVEGELTAYESSNTPYFTILHQVAKLHKPVDITGGEPFFRDDLSEIIYKLIDSGVAIGSVFTNGTLFVQKINVVDDILKMTGSIPWYVSLDGNLESHDQLRGNGSYEAALSGIMALVKRNQKLRINTMLHSDLSEEPLLCLYETLKNMGIERWRIDGPFISGAWCSNRQVHSVSHKRQIELLLHVIKLWLNDDMPFELELGHVLKYIKGALYFLDSYSLSDPVCPCRTLPVWPNGDVTWCQDLLGKKHVIGNVLTDDMHQIYERYSGYKTIAIGELANHNDKCKDCPLIKYCGVGCRVMALGANRGYYGADPNSCDLYRKRLYLPIANELRKYAERIRLG